MLRVLAERHTLSPQERQLVLKGLKDGDDFVRRAAADALGQHPAAENVRPLFQLRAAVALAHPQAWPIAWKGVAVLARPPVTETRLLAGLVPAIPGRVLRWQLRPRLQDSRSKPALSSQQL